MQIELTGCTGAGKSTLARHLIQTYQSQGAKVLLADEFVLGQVGLNRVTHPLARTLLLDLVALPACLLTWRMHHEFYAFAIRLIRDLPASWFEKLNLVRNVLKKIGMYEIIRQRSDVGQVVLVDEGTVHAAHNLFVHVSAPAAVDDVLTFILLVPLPEVLVYVHQPERVLIERTLERGHKRIPDHSPASVARFVRRALEMFELLARQPVVAERWLALDSQQGTIALPHHSSESISRALSLLRSGFGPDGLAANSLPDAAPELQFDDSHVAAH